MTPEWTTAMPDWGDRIRTSRSIIPPPIFPEQADQALAIFKEFRIVDAPGSPRIGDAVAQWVFDLVGALFGSYDAESGRRLITEYFVCIPKKSSKSTIAGAIALTALILNWRQSASFTILSPTVQVASNSFEPAKDMVAKDDELEALIQIQSHIKTMTHRQSGATLKVLAADSNTVAGLKSVGLIVDELWLFGKQVNAEAMLREATGGLASRPEGFVIYLTTQSDEPPAGIFKSKLQYARDVRDGKIVDNGFLPVIWEHPDDMVANGDCLKLENMAMVNPNLGYSVDKQFLEREFKKAEMEGGDAFRGYLAKHGNVEIGLNLRSDRWAGADFWLRQAVPRFTLTDLIARCEVATVGIDGGGLDDLLGLTVIGREKVTGKWMWWAHAWAHEIVLERRKEIAPRLLDFQKDGDLTIVALPGQDVDGVADIVCRLASANMLPAVHAVGVDAAGIGAIFNELTTRGIKTDQIIAIRQGYTLNGPIKDTERKLAGGEIIHAGSAMMAWCVGNARIEDKGNAILITKQVSGKSKIDPLMSGFSAVALMALSPAAPGQKFQFFSIG